MTVSYEHSCQLAADAIAGEGSEGDESLPDWEKAFGAVLHPYL